MSLALLQREMIAWLRCSDAAAAARLGGGRGPGVYLNNHRAALMASLGGSYPMLRQWLGEAAFDALAAHHAEACPPNSWTLDAYGADFAETLTRLRPAEPVLADLPRLEWALGQAFIAADANALTIAGLGAVDWDAAVLRLVPSAETLPLATNADAILAALLGEEPLPAAETMAQPAAVLVWRAGFVPRFRRIEADEAQFIPALAVGLGFAALCEALVGAQEEAAGIAAAGQLLARWAADELCRVSA